MSIIQLVSCGSTLLQVFSTGKSNFINRSVPFQHYFMTSAEICGLCLPGNVPFHSPSLHGHTVTQPSAQHVYLVHSLEKCQHLLELSVIPKIGLWWSWQHPGLRKEATTAHPTAHSTQWVGAQDSSNGSGYLQLTTALWTQLCSHSRDPSVSLGIKVPKGGSGLQGWHLRV